MTDQQKHASPVQLARMKDGEDLDAFFARCKGMATPLHVVSAIYKQISTFLEDMNARNQERNAKIASLEARVTAIEDRGVEYKGVFTPGQEYRRGDACTMDGALWIAKRKTTGRPGVDFDGWQLAVMRGKPGRDGKDARP